MKNKTRIVSIRLDEDLYQFLSGYSDIHHLAMSDVIRVILFGFKEAYKNGNEKAD